VLRTFGLRSLPAQSAIKGMISHAMRLNCLGANLLTAKPRVMDYGFGKGTFVMVDLSYEG
jgi:hypothetical protein